jgi:hypothetical protein
MEGAQLSWTLERRQSAPAHRGRSYTQAIDTATLEAVNQREVNPGVGCIRGWLGRVPTGTRHVVDRGSDVKYGSAEVACPSTDHQHAQHAVFCVAQPTKQLRQHHRATRRAAAGTAGQQAAASASSWQQASKRPRRPPRRAPRPRKQQARPRVTGLMSDTAYL